MPETPLMRSGQYNGEAENHAIRFRSFNLTFVNGHCGRLTASLRAAHDYRIQPVY